MYAISIVLTGVGLWLAHHFWTSGREERSSPPWLHLGLAVALAAAGTGLGLHTYSNDMNLEYGPDKGITGKAAPELTFRRLDDAADVALSDLRGKVVLLNLWATWCPPCIAELEDLSRLQETHGDRGLVVVTLSDETPEVLREFAVEHPVETLNAYLPDEARWSPPYDRVENARPTTFVIDRQGTFRATWPGAASYGHFARAVEPYL